MRVDSWDLECQISMNIYDMKQFQIEGGGMVQGVKKFILTFSPFFDLRNWICRLRWEKMELINHNSEVKGLSKIG